MPSVIALQARGYINSEHTLTDAGKEALIENQRIGNATVVFAKGVGKTADETSLWELYKGMIDDRWDHKLRPATEKKHICTAFKHGEPRVVAD